MTTAFPPELWKNSRSFKCEGEVTGVRFPPQVREAGLMVLVSGVVVAVVGGIVGGIMYFFHSRKKQNKNNQ